MSLCFFLQQNKMHINDWQSIQTLWDKLNKQVEKTQKVTGALGTPRPFIKIMAELEDFLNKTLAGKIDGLGSCLHYNSVQQVVLSKKMVKAVPAGFEPARVAPIDPSDSSDQLLNPGLGCSNQSP